MARDNRLKYLLVDADFFDKENLFQIENEFDFFGGYVAIRLLLWTAQREGWGVPWGETGAAYFAAKGLGDKSKTKEVAEIAAKMAEVGFFDRRAHDAGFLTSRRILEDWRSTMARNKREINLEDLPHFIVEMMDPPEPAENPAVSVENSAEIAETPPEPAENPAVSGAREDKNRLDYISTLSSARARTREEAAEPESDPYSEEERAAAMAKIDLWNETVQGTGAEYSEIYPQEIVLSRIIDRSRKTPKEEDWRRAFKAARRQIETGDMPWTLPAVFNKPGNFDLLKISKPKTAAKTAGNGRFGADKPGFGEEGFYK